MASTVLSPNTKALNSNDEVHCFEPQASRQEAVEDRDEDSVESVHRTSLDEAMRTFDRITSTSQSETSDNSASSGEAEESLQDAVASSSALVGENVLDSPQDCDGKPIISFGIEHHSHRHLHHHRRHSSKAPPDLMAPPLTIDNANAVSVGIMAQGLAWVRRQRERRQRIYLHHQAAMQLKKIKEAQAAEKLKSGRSLTENPTFQALANVVRIGGNSHCDTEDDGDDQDEYATVVSKSGAGFTVEFPFSVDREDEDAAFIPPVRVEKEYELKLNPFILNQKQRNSIAALVLPRGIAYARWKRLYSLARDGDSFDACLRLVHKAAPTLLVIRTSRNAILGGFADAPWDPDAFGGSYYGGANACLFKVDDATGKVKVFKWTGVNRYIQLCDLNHKMLAFGGGGEDGAFGLCVEQDFQLGSTGSCDTFENEPLCDQENFEIVDMEIFGFLLGQF